MKIFDFIQEKLSLSPILEELLILSLLFIVVSVFYYILRCILKKITLRVVNSIVHHSKTNWVEVLRSRHFFSRLFLLFPGLIIYKVSSEFFIINDVVSKLSLSYVVFVIFFIIYASMSTVNDVYETYKISEEKPLKGIIQSILILLYIIEFVLIVSILLDISPFYFLSSIGAMTAILVVVFRNTILSFVAGLQLTSQHLIKKGDWITMPQYKADGDVVDIALHTVKVQNFDKTVVSIPTYKLLEESFQNWRGMKEAGGRRIKRSINIDMTSVRFLTDQELKRFKKIVYLEGYLEKKTSELDKYNKENKINLRDRVSGRRLTNFGTFRNYIYNYLERHPKINKDLKLMVRQMESSEKGMPIEIYAFTRETDWVQYETVQADIFDHIISIVPEFGLRIYQAPTGSDFKRIALKGRS